MIWVSVTVQTLWRALYKIKPLIALRDKNAGINFAGDEKKPDKYGEKIVWRDETEINGFGQWHISCSFPSLHHHGGFKSNNPDVIKVKTFQI